MKLLIVTPLKIEYSTLAQILRNDLQDPQFVLAPGGHGKVEFALKAFAAIQQHQPDLLVCTGSCGSLSPDIKPCDVVVATETIEHDYSLRLVEKPLPSFWGDSESLKVLQDFKANSLENKNFALHFGAIASGDEDIISNDRAQAIRQKTRAVAVAWEGAGGARAARLAKIPFLEIRAVTDSADGKTASDFQTYLQEALGNLAKTLKQLHLALKNPPATR